MLLIKYEIKNNFFFNKLVKNKFLFFDSKLNLIIRD